MYPNTLLLNLLSSFSAPWLSVNQHSSCTNLLIEERHESLYLIQSPCADVMIITSWAADADRTLGHHIMSSAVNNRIYRYE